MLSACGSSVDEGGGGGGTGGGGGAAIPSIVLAYGTGAGEPLGRREERTVSGNGTAEGIIYDSSSDTFEVENLPFDGDNSYARDNSFAGAHLPGAPTFAVYENDRTTTDPVTGAVINQFRHKAIRAVSSSGNVQFSIVRTGEYVGYGFGGFIYQRNNSVTLPTDGQAHYTGNYGGIRDFDGQGGLQYTTGTMNADLDFLDGSMRADVRNRRIYDVDGTDITDTITDTLGLTVMPTLRFRVGPDAIRTNGDVVGTVQSSYTDGDGHRVPYETGNYYAVISGDNAEEVVGIIVVEPPTSDTGVTTRETGGFILHRQ